MTEKLYYWAKNLAGYSSDNEKDYDQIIEIKRLNFFIGKNNAGKSRFLRSLFFNKETFTSYNISLMNLIEFQEIVSLIGNKNNTQLKSKMYVDDEGFPLNSNKYALEPTPIPDDEFSQLIEIITFFKKNNYFETENFKEHYKKLDFLKNYEIDENHTFNNLVTKLIGNFIKFSTSIKFSTLQNKYIPTLRGLRPLQQNNPPAYYPFVTRTFIDYFEKK